MFQDDKQVTAIRGLPIKTITVVPFAAGQMERVFTNFPNFFGFNVMQRNVIKAIVVPLQFSNSH